MARYAWEALIQKYGFASTGKVAEAAKMNDGHLWQIASSGKDPRLSTVIRLANTIGCSLDELALAIRRDTEKPPSLKQAANG